LLKSGVSRAKARRAATSLGITTMTLEVVKKERENSQSMLRRFSKGMQQSGILVRARKLQFKTKKKSKGMRKKAALRRAELKIEFAKNKKMMKEDKTKNKRFRK
jgi:hypothetical protein